MPDELPDLVVVPVSAVVAGISFVNLHVLDVKMRRTRTDIVTFERAGERSEVGVKGRVCEVIMSDLGSRALKVRDGRRFEVTVGNTARENMSWLQEHIISSF